MEILAHWACGHRRGTGQQVTDGLISLLTCRLFTKFTPYVGKLIQVNVFV